MARLAAIEKALYYPTPPHLIETLVKHHLRLNLHGYSATYMLDPCAGEGVALATLANAWKHIEMADWARNQLDQPYWRDLHDKAVNSVTLHAVELDNERAPQAAQRVDMLIHAPIEHVSSTGPYTVVFCNPPYDQNGAGGRQELTWIKLVAPLVAEHGTLILVLPDMFVGEGRYANALRKLMVAGHFDEDLVLRFPDPEYDQFKQVFIVARKTDGRWNEINLRFAGVLGQTSRTFTARTTSLAKPPMLFRTIEADLQESHLLASSDLPLRDLLGDPDVDGARMTPLMQMRTEHAAMVAAAGMFNGAVIDGKIVKGSTVKKEVRVVDEYTTDAGTLCTQETIAEVHAAQLAMLDMTDGTIEIVNSTDHKARFEDVLLTNAQTFVNLAFDLYPPFFNGDTATTFDADLARVRAPRRIAGTEDELFEPQRIRAAATLYGWKNQRVTTVVGEMGTGKTAISLAATAVKATHRQAHNQKIVVLLPPKQDLVDKWAEEIKTSLREFKPKTIHVETISDVQRAFDTPGLVFILLKETTAKISSGWKPIPPHIRKRKDKTFTLCPFCRQRLTYVAHGYESKTGEPPDPSKLQCHCANCKEPLWTMTRRSTNGSAGYARYPLAKYIRDHYRDRYLLIMDEAHGYKSGDSARGYAAQDLLSSCHRAIQMTGTIYNGMASSIFFLIWRALPSFRKIWGHGDVQAFINQYGLFETVRKTYTSVGRTTASGYDETQERKSERPGVAPAMIAMLLPSTVFLGIRDLGIVLPPYAEHTLFVEKPKDFWPIDAYLDTMRADAVARMYEGEYSLLAQFTWAKQGAWDVASAGDQVTDQHLAPIHQLAPIRPPASGLWPKEEALLRLIAQEKRTGRRVLCFVSQINRRDPTPRLLTLLEQYGMRGAVMRADEKNRVAFIRRSLALGADVIFTSAPLVKEGVDILECQTIAWFGIEYSTYLIPQANRRSWRIGQTQPVHVYYIAYNETPQAEAMHHIAHKLAAAQALQGDIRSGLAELLGEPDFVNRLQAATVTADHFESELTLADLPALTVFTPQPKPEPARPERVDRILAIPIDIGVYQQLSLF